MTPIRGDEVSKLHAYHHQDTLGVWSRIVSDSGWAAGCQQREQHLVHEDLLLIADRILSVPSTELIQILAFLILPMEYHHCSEQIQLLKRIFV